MAERFRTKVKISKIADRKFYAAWAQMKRRCYNPSHNRYSRYGARGIEVCERWMSFINFYNDMWSAYLDSNKTGSLDRIDNNGNYEPSNCRWVENKEQANNRSTNRLVEYRGEVKTLAQWITTLGLKSSTVRQRFYVYNWSVQKSFEYKQGA